MILDRLDSKRGVDEFLAIKRPSRQHEAALDLVMPQFNPNSTALPTLPRTINRRHADQDALTVKGGDQVQVHVQLNVAVNDHIHAAVNGG